MRRPGEGLTVLSVDRREGRQTFQELLLTRRLTGARRVVDGGMVWLLPELW